MVQQWPCHLVFQLKYLKLYLCNLLAFQNGLSLSSSSSVFHAGDGDGDESMGVGVRIRVAKLYNNQQLL